MNDDHLRMSDTERDEAARELGEHYAVGRLTTEEHSERLDRIWAARTRGELAPIFRDLPGRLGRPSPGPWRPSVGPVPDLGRRRSATTPWRRGIPTPLLVLLGVLLVVTVVSHLPVILIGLLVWFFVVSRHRHHHYSRR